MEKIKLEEFIPKNKKVTFNEQMVEVKPYLSLTEQVALANKYIEDYFSEDNQKIIIMSSQNRFKAEFNLMLNIFTICTDIDMENFNQEILASTSLYKDVVEKIYNYAEFKEMLDFNIKDIKEQIANSKALGSVIEQVASVLYSYLSNLSEFSPQTIDNLAKVVEEIKVISGENNSPPKKTVKPKKTESKTEVL